MGKGTGRDALMAVVALAALMAGGCGGETPTTPSPGAADGGHAGSDHWAALPLPTTGVSFSLPGALLEAQNTRPVLEAGGDGVVRIDWESTDLFQGTGGYCLAVVCSSRTEGQGPDAKKAVAPPVTGGTGIDLGSARLTPARVSELDDQGAFPGLFALEVPAATAKGIRPGTDQFIVFAPEGATADQIRTVPPLVRFDEGSLNAYLAVLVRQKQLAESYRDQARSVAVSINNLKQIGLALHNFHSVMDHFPPAVVYGPDGKPWHSWRVLILAYLEQQPLYDAYRFDEPWDGPNNRKLLDKMPDVYRMPGDTSHFTHYVVPVGPNVAFLSEGAKVPEGKDATSFAPYAQNHKGYRGIVDFTDGTSNTIAAGTISPGRKIEWMKPEDLPIVVDPMIGLASPSLGDEKGFATPYKSDDGPFGVFLFTDGSVRSIHQSVDKRVFSALLTPNLGEVVSSDSFGGGKTTLSAAVLSPTFQVEVKQDGPTARARLREIPAAEPPSPEQKPEETPAPSSTLTTPGPP
jgi:hypothetical protein